MLRVNNLIGFGAFSLPPFTVQHHATVVSNAATIVIPGTVLAGDIAVLFDHAYNNAGSTPSSVTPSGFAQLLSTTKAAGTDRDRAESWYKILASGDIGATLTGMNDTGENKILFIFRGTRPIVTATESPTWSGESSSTEDAGSETVSASGSTPPVIVFGFGADRNTTIGFSVQSPAFDATALVSNSDAIGGYKIYNTSPQNHTIQADTGAGTNRTIHAGGITVSPT